VDTTSPKGRAAIRRLTRAGALAGALLAAGGAAWRPAAGAVPQQLAPPGIAVGSQPVTGASWTFDGDFAAGEANTGSWSNVTVTSTDCATPDQPGDDQAVVIVFTAWLAPTVSHSGQTVYAGDLWPFAGSNANGHVNVTAPSPPDPAAHVDATLEGLEPSALNNSLTVCLTPTSQDAATPELPEMGAGAR
jgi:hypothetical protein